MDYSLPSPLPKRGVLQSGCGVPEELLSHLQDRKLTCGRWTRTSSKLEHTDSLVTTTHPDFPSQKWQSVSNSSNQSGEVISRIEDVFESVADCIVEERKELVIQLKSRGGTKLRACSSQDTDTKKKPAAELRDVKFPSRSPQEAWKFSTCIGHGLA